MVAHAVGDRVPMARRRLGVGAVGPELSEHPAVVAAPHDVRRIRSARGRVGEVTFPVVLAEAVPTENPGRDVDGDAVVGRQFAAATDDLDDALDEPRVARVPETWRQTRVDPEPARIIADQREGPDVAPLGSGELLHDVDREVVLVERVGDGERLPIVRCRRERCLGEDDHRPARRRVTAVRGIEVLVRLPLACSVVDEVRGDRRRHEVAEPGRGRGVA